MDTKNIEVLLRAIELGSLSKAAEEYLYTPSAVKHILDSVEEEIGTKIVRRTYKGIEPLFEAEEILEGLKRLVKEEKNILKIAAEKEKGKKTITIATYSSISKYLLPQIIKGFKKLFPHIDIEIIVVDDYVKICDDNIIDVFFGERNDEEDCNWEELIKDPYVAVLPEGYKLSESRIKREALCKTPFIMAKNSAINKYMKEQEIKDIIRIESHDDSSVLQMVKAGMGIAVLPSLSVEKGGGVICRELEPPLVRVLGISYRKNDFKKKSHIRSFVEYIRENKGQFKKGSDQNA